MLDKLKQSIEAGHTKINVLEIECNSAVVNELLELVRSYRLEITEIQLSFTKSNSAQRSEITLEFIKVLQHLSGVKKFVLNGPLQNYALSYLLSNETILELEHFEFNYGDDRDYLFKELLPSYLLHNKVLSKLVVKDSQVSFSLTTDSYPSLTDGMINHPSLIYFDQGGTSLFIQNALEKDGKLQSAFRQRINQNPTVKKQTLDQEYEQELRNLIQATNCRNKNAAFYTQQIWNLTNIKRLKQSYEKWSNLLKEFSTLSANCTPEVQEDIENKKTIIGCSIEITKLFSLIAHLKNISETKPDKLSQLQQQRVDIFLNTERHDILTEVVSSLQSGKTEQIRQKIIELGKEFSAILVSVTPVVFPSSYTAITDKQQDRLLKAKLLLQDYTKNNSALSRFFHGHWNRHHVSAVNNIVLRINSTKEDGINNIDALVSELNNIKLFNKNGSLARRIQFIVTHYKEPSELFEVPDEVMRISP